MKCLVLLGAMLSSTVALAAEERCAGQGTSIVVDTSEHELVLCERGVSKHHWSVSLGRGGVEKRRQGDLKTPLGTYSLGAPRVSKKFGLFVPIGYPTPEQKRAGFTGGDVGIHGPSRKFTWAGGLNTLVDWTQGCIAVSSDDAMKEVAGWVKRFRPKQIHISR